MKKKICFLIYDLRTGGAENMVCQISNELSNEFDITILTINNYNHKYIIKKNINLKSLKIKKISKSIKHLYVFFKKNEFDLIISNVWPITIIASFLSLFFKKTKIMIIEHSVLTDQFLFYHNFFNRFLRKISVSIFYNFANKVISVSKVSKRSLIKLGVKEKNIKVIYNFSNIKKNKNDINFFDQFVKNKKTIKLLNIGIFKKIKNQDFLIEVAYILLNKYKLNFILLIVGSGPLEKKLMKKINFLNLNQNIKIIISNKDLNNTVSNCDIYLSASLSESFGLTVLDALHLNKKVVVSRIEASKEIINKEHKEFICDLNTELFAKKIIDLSSKNIKNIDKLYKNKFNKGFSIQEYKKEIYSLL